MNGLQRYLGSKIKIYIYDSVEAYDKEEEDTVLENVLLLGVSDDFIDIEDSKGLIHRINLKRCFSIVVEKEGSTRY